MKSPSLGEKLYTGAAEVGMFRVWAGFAIACIIGIILIGFGISMLKNQKTSVTATVTSVTSGQTSTTAGKITITYNVGVSYTLNGVNYNQTLSSTTPYSVNQTVTVYVNSSEPSSATFTTQFSGWYLIIGAIVIIGVAILMVWLAKRYKFFAAVQGAGMASDVITGRSIF